MILFLCLDLFSLLDMYMLTAFEKLCFDAYLAKAKSNKIETKKLLIRMLNIFQQIWYKIRNTSLGLFY